ncbi:hypothetical protein D0Y65_011502 [Glycine soja]|uniref:Reverse transcriptase zinc-binding domain-containing protein n=1 Tax=Glycine soja TaxID=3848 RepID=A0A445KK57_GLYSO|nr:hypothetical protein D0Y65_011502 [Glycine soja]
MITFYNIISPKINHFLWRVLRQCLPTRARLITKGVECPLHCYFCSQSYENEWHIFFACDKAKEVWQAAGLWHLIHPKAGSAEGFKDLLSTFSIIFNNMKFRS